MMVLIVAAVLVCAAVVAVAVGRGGQLGASARDRPPLDLPARRAISGDDVALLRLPVGMWGYDYGATDEALQRIARALAERDTRIAVLEQECAELRGDPSAWVPARGHDVAPELPRRRDTRSEETGPMPRVGEPGNPAARPRWPHLNAAERGEDDPRHGPSWFEDAGPLADGEDAADQDEPEPDDAGDAEDQEVAGDDQGDGQADQDQGADDQQDPQDAEPQVDDELVASGGNAAESRGERRGDA